MLSHDKKSREIYEDRMKAQRDKASMLHHAREEGMQHGLQQGMQRGMQQGMQRGMQQGEHNAQQKIAIKLLLRGNSDADVIDYTGLSLEEVKKLQEKIRH
jgi:flagellar biosynthesis/type III secretory pathway protein FliH